MFGLDFEELVNLLVQTQYCMFCFMSSEVWESGTSLAKREVWEPGTSPGSTDSGEGTRLAFWQ